jgi:hypothetical protein
VLITNIYVKGAMKDKLSLPDDENPEVAKQKVAIREEVAVQVQK